MSGDEILARLGEYVLNLDRLGTTKSAQEVVVSGIPAHRAMAEQNS